MLTTLEVPTQEALVLPPDQRIALAHRLLTSVEPDPDPGAEAAWEEEIARRIVRADARESTPVPVATRSLSVSLPEPLHRSVEALAQREGISVDQFIASATAEKLAAWEGLEHLRRAAQGRREDLEHFLAAMPDVGLQESDRLPGE